MSVSDSTVSRIRGTAVQYPINIRITLPFLPRPVFITVIAGAEKRCRVRRIEERKRHPLNTWGNLAAFVAGSTVAGTAILFASLIAANL